MGPRGTIVYVHGASDRSAGVADHVARIENQLELAAMAFDVLPSSWGEVAGADLSRIDLSLPRVTPAEVSEPPPIDAAPLVALAAVAQPGTAVLQFMDAANIHRQSDELLEVCQTQIGAPGESITLADGRSIPLASACRNAASGIATSREYATARTSAVTEPALVDAVGRAVVSSVAAPAASPGDVAALAQVRIAEAVLSAAIGALLVGYLGIDIGPDLKRWATDVLLPHRARLMREAGLGPADIVLYQRAGEHIREHVAQTLRQAIERGGPVVALGNSLGGIILVDLLSAEGAPRPNLLVTAGSQAPLLATFGALAPLGAPGSPPPFQPWLNIYDRRDLLSFVAAPVWPAESGITDYEVDLGVGFPDSHGASYLSSPQVFRAIREHPALG